MTINQLFKTAPPTELFYRYCHLFGLSGINDRHWFNKRDLISRRTVEKITQTMSDDLRRLYLDCKVESYLSDITEQSAITILRQLAKASGYTVARRTVTANGKRFTEYQLNKT